MITENIPGRSEFSLPRVSDGGLGIVTALLVRWQISCLCVYTGGPIQLYSLQVLMLILTS